METKLKLQKCLVVILFLLLFSFVGYSQDKLAKKTIDDFLNVWLVKKDLKSVQKYFSAKLFTNKYLFKEPCRNSDDIKRKSKNRKAESIRFFREIAQNSPKKSLQEILISDTGIRDFSEVELLSDPQKDKFILTKETLEGSNGEDIHYLKTKFPSKKYLILQLIINTKYDGEGNIPIGLIWGRQNLLWKIVGFAIDCQ